MDERIEKFKSELKKTDGEKLSEREQGLLVLLAEAAIIMEEQHLKLEEQNTYIGQTVKLLKKIKKEVL